MSHASDRINKIAKKYNFTRYLEIGVRDGDTFLHVDMPHKTAVDPNFVFPINEHQSPLTRYFDCTSDEFFDKFDSVRHESPYTYRDEEFLFDIVYIDGMHTFEQSYRDFTNVLRYVHDRSVIIFDDTVPCDPYSLIPDQAISYRLRALANITGKPWHGDVCKTVVAIHDFHPDYAYATQISLGNPQTIVWKAKPSKRPQYMGDMAKIASMDYAAFCAAIPLYIPVEDAVALEMIGMDVPLSEYTREVDLARIVGKVHTKAGTAKEVKSLTSKIADLEKKVKALEKNTNVKKTLSFRLGNIIVEETKNKPIFSIFTLPFKLFFEYRKYALEKIVQGTKEKEG